jgi:uncharacterized protein YjbK
MNVPTQVICDYLKSSGVERDDSQLFGRYVGYIDSNGEVLVVDESIYLQSTEMLIDDCVANESYAIASLIDKWAKEQAT